VSLFVELARVAVLSQFLLCNVQTLLGEFRRGYRIIINLIFSDSCAKERTSRSAAVVFRCVGSGFKEKLAA